MANLNKVILIGNVTRDIELRKTQSGISTCNFSIAVNRPKSQNGNEGADYPSIVAWRQTAEVCAKYLSKGSSICVEGHLQTRSYEKDRAKVYVTEVVADHIEFLGKKPNSEYTEVRDDDCPF